MVSTCEKLIIIRKMPYWAYWPSFGFLIFLLSELFIFLFRGENYFWTRFLFCGGLGFVPTFCIALLRSFDNIFSPLQGIFFDDAKDDFDKWCYRCKENIFTLKTSFSKIVVFGITISATCTFVCLGIPFKTLFLKISVIIVFAMIAFFCGVCLYISIALLLILRELSLKENIKIMFLDFPNSAIKKLQSFYSMISVVVIIFYLGLALGIWLGPYGFNIPMIVWLSLLALYPLTMIIWSIIHIHIILSNVKDGFFKDIIIEIERTKESVFSNHRLHDIIKLEKLIPIHSYITKLKDWPFAIESSLTLLGSIGVAAMQLIITILSIKSK